MILIIDDDRAIRLAIGLMLKQAGFESESVATEDDAIGAVRRREYELIILDLNLTLATTGRQGIELLRKIRIFAPKTPVIMLSAWATVPLAVEGMGFGAVDFVSKPWKNSDFVARIRKALADAEKKAEADRIETLEATERQAIVRALRECDGNISAASALLGITRQSLYRRMQKFGIT